MSAPQLPRPPPPLDWRCRPPLDCRRALISPCTPHDVESPCRGAAKSKPPLPHRPPAAAMVSEKEEAAETMAEDMEEEEGAEGGGGWGAARSEAAQLETEVNAMEEQALGLRQRQVRRWLGALLCCCGCVFEGEAGPGFSTSGCSIGQQLSVLFAG